MSELEPLKGQGEQPEKEAVREKWRRLGLSILETSQNELMVSMRFLTLAFPMLTPVMHMGTFYMGTDGTYLYYNPRFVSQRYAQSNVLVNRGYLHMLLHCIFRHNSTPPRQKGESASKKLWELSCDVAVEYMIDSMEEACVLRLVPEKREQLYQKLEEHLDVLTAEGIYGCLMEEEMPWGEEDSLYLEFLVDDHVFWQSEDKETPEQKKNRQEQQKEKQEEWRELSKKIETGLETYFRSAGTGNRKLLSHLKKAGVSQMDYREFLRKFARMTEEMQVDMDSFDYGFYQYGMELYGNMPLIEELEYKEEKRIQDFVIVVDTSGSCSGALTKQFLGETFSILKSQEIFGQQVKIHMIQCDNEVKEDILITSAQDWKAFEKDFTVKGGGGTDFRPVFQYVEALQAKNELAGLKGLIYFTDGYGTYPRVRPPYDVVFAFVEGQSSQKEVPPWAMKLVIPNMK